MGRALSAGATSTTAAALAKRVLWSLAFARLRAPWPWSWRSSWALRGPTSWPRRTASTTGCWPWPIG